MSNTLLAVTSLIYASVAFDYWRKGQNGMVIVFVAYAVANLGFIWAGRK